MHKYIKYKNKYIELKTKYIHTPKILLLTFPHASCPTYLQDSRKCDIATQNICNIFVKQLTHEGIKYESIFNSLILRSDCDLNRAVCHKTSENKTEDTDFIKNIKNKLDNTYLLLDIHSFHENKNNDDFYILYNHKHKFDAEKLLEYLNLKLNLKLNMYPGGDNYIINTAATISTNTALLFEFKEAQDENNPGSDLTNNRNNLIINIISWIKQIYTH